MDRPSHDGEVHAKLEHVNRQVRDAVIERAASMPATNLYTVRRLAILEIYPKLQNTDFAGIQVSRHTTGRFGEKKTSEC